MMTKELDEMTGEATTKKVANDPAVRARLRTLLDLAITIGRREGLIGDHEELTSKGEEHVTD